MAGSLTILLLAAAPALPAQEIVRPGDPSLRLDRLRMGVDSTRVVNSHSGRPPPAPDSWVPGIGLSATRERLEKLYGSGAQLEVEVNDERTSVSLRLPWKAARVPEEALG